MPKAGRPKGLNNKTYNYTVRLDESTKIRLEKYCKEFNLVKSDVIRDAILNAVGSPPKKEDNPI